ncbi:hypothetical protein MYP_444 [Sporocytophaga myxococcoides]|uniref:Uncharacterized protein n=1 Tax=Sporocytophaga myxococcoides TaxID=153721 RepID=A0A098LA56_9BACT|nr:hypothetical protein [Sporocytophaga myxococcoides]GAL83218.1 hypothetical protein MYP_444 [Sporocytophaga myxococcoides]
MRTIDQSNYEEWIFEYYEGTLTAEEEVQVLDFVQRDSIYMEEFEAFSKTYLREPLPDKLSIESSLLRKGSYFNINYSIASFLFIIVSGLFFIKTSEEQSEVINASKELIVQEEYQEKEVVIKSSSIPKHKSIIPQLSRKERTEQSYMHNQNLYTDTGNTFIPSIDNEAHKANNDVIKIDYDSLPAEQPVIIKTERASVGTTKTIVKKTRQEKKEERRKQKQIARFKEKQRRNKEAQQLMKGNMPYVVPLDPNTF